MLIDKQDPVLYTGIVFEILRLFGWIPEVNDRLTILSRGLAMMSRVDWRICMCILKGPEDFGLSLKIMVVSSASSTGSKAKEFWIGSGKKSLKDLLPSYFLSFRIELAIVEKQELKF